MERLGAAELGIDLSTAPARLRCVRLVRDDDLARTIFPRLVQQPLPEPVMAPRQHRPRRLAVELALALGDHLRRLEFGNDHASVVLAEPLGEFLV